LPLGALHSSPLQTLPGNSPRWTFPATVDAGGRETGTIDGLNSGSRLTLWIVARDAQGEQSLPSNELVVQIGVPDLLAFARGPAVVSLAQPARLPATLLWKAAPGMTRQTLSIYDLAGRLRRRFDLGSGAKGSLEWDGSDRSGEPLESGVYFMRLESGSAHASARIVLVR
jgi:hypothetical protein